MIVAYVAYDYSDTVAGLVECSPEQRAAAEYMVDKGLEGEVMLVTDGWTYLGQDPTTFDELLYRTARWGGRRKGIEHGRGCPLSVEVDMNQRLTAARGCGCWRGW